MKSSPRGVVAAHASLAAALVAAVEAITGRTGTLVSVSNDGLSGRAVRDAIAHALDDSGAAVVFTDLPAGSCALAARRLLRERPGLSVVTGVNLPMLLEFALRDDQPADALAAAVVRGREHIQQLPDVG
jgi:mannose/fructose-specific phosphotransferase system component IIA